MIEIGRGLRVTSLIFLLVFTTAVSGCTNVREVETFTSVEEVSRYFIDENEAIKVVAGSREVAGFRRSTPAPCLIQVEKYPTAGEPFYVIRVAEDLGDRLVMYDQYTVDAYSGDIID
ncbi:MAG: hypothetical protein GX052_07795 [Syntrophomonadaceae bacterium]|jgi:hypothetical protein|nr:hypothetical protein [Syntrophomonadaceae bacterium]